MAYSWLGFSTDVKLNYYWDPNNQIWHIMAQHRYFFFSQRFNTCDLLDIMYNMSVFFDSSVEEWGNSFAKALELPQSCTEPSNFGVIWFHLAPTVALVVMSGIWRMFIGGDISCVSWFISIYSGGHYIITGVSYMGICNLSLVANHFESDSYQM